MIRDVAYLNSTPSPHVKYSPCITTENRTILNMSDINHRRRKLFNIRRGAYPARPTSILGGGGGGIAKCSRTHAHTYDRMYTLLNVQTPMHTCTHICMHACICTHTFIHLHPDMKSIKIKANDFYEEKKYIHVILLQVSEVNEESFRLLYYLKSI